MIIYLFSHAGKRKPKQNCAEKKQLLYSYQKKVPWMKPNKQQEQQGNVKGRVERQVEQRKNQRKIHKIKNFLFQPLAN